MEKEANEVNPTLKFFLSNNNVVINLILIIAVIWAVIFSTILLLKGKIGLDLALNIVLMIIGSFLGASLLKYAKSK